MGDEDVVGPVSGIQQIGRTHPGDPLGNLYPGISYCHIVGPLALEAEGEVRAIGCDLEPLDSSYIEGIRDIEDREGVLGKARYFEGRSRIGAEAQGIVRRLEGPEVVDLYPVEQEGAGLRA